ncbi:MAG: glutathione-disulfide reductase, partial [Pseudomonadota bacterium]
NGMQAFDYDLFVIGAGSGGVRAARIAATHGARVAIAEEFRYGGTCVIRGCVPKKLLVYASRFPDEFRAAEGFGWSKPETSFDWPTLIANKNHELDRLENAYLSNLEKAGVTSLRTRAVLKDAHTVHLISEDRTVTAKHILIATGGWPNMHEGLPGLEHAITSNEALDLERLPERIVIAGGGYIAIEFAGIFAHLGVDTTIIYRREKVLRGFDEDLRDRVIQRYGELGVRFVTNDVFAAIEKTDDGLVGKLKSGSEVVADEIMFAIGRNPNTADLGLEAAGVAMDDRGAITVDAFSQTNVPHIFAVGDVTDRVPLTPVAIREGHAFADTVFGGDRRSVDYDKIPTAVFATPEIGTVGLTEDEAREKHPELDVYAADFRPMKATLAGTSERMFMKLLVDRTNDRVVGCHIAGEGAAEMIQIIGVVMKMGGRKADFDSTMALHPSAAEELVTMRQPSRQYGAVASNAA